MYSTVLVNDSVFFVEGVSHTVLLMSKYQGTKRKLRKSPRRTQVCYATVISTFSIKNEWVADNNINTDEGQVSIFFNFIHVKIPLLTPHRIISYAH